jgi:hypothetical protein
MNREIETSHGESLLPAPAVPVVGTALQMGRAHSFIATMILWLNLIPDTCTTAGSKTLQSGLALSNVFSFSWKRDSPSRGGE